MKEEPKGMVSAEALARIAECITVSLNEAERLGWAHPWINRNVMQAFNEVPSIKDPTTGEYEVGKIYRALYGLHYEGVKRRGAETSGYIPYRGTDSTPDLENYRVKCNLLTYIIWFMAETIGDSIRDGLRHLDLLKALDAYHIALGMNIAIKAACECGCKWGEWKP